MRFEKIVFNNYRQYKYLKLEFPKGPHDIHIIIAKNGVGKTNFLNALTWCFYDIEPHLGKKDQKEQLPRVNISALDEARLKGNDKVIVSVKVYASEGEKKLIFEVSMPVKVTDDSYFAEKATHSVQISDGQDFKTFEGDESKAYVEKYMPEKIRDYIYFDGEQLDKYFISDRSEKIREAIYSISQVEIVRRIYERLDSTIYQKQKEAGAKAPDLKRINDDLENYKKQEDEALKDKNQINSQIELSEQKITLISEYLQGQENLPELETQYQQIRDKQTTLEQKQKKVNRDFFAFVREKKIALTYYSDAKWAIELIDKKRSENALPPNIDKNMLLEMLRKHRCLICDNELLADSEAHIQALIQQFQVSSETSNILSGIYDELTRIVVEARAYPSDRAKIMQSISEVEDELKKAEKELQDLENKTSRFSDKDQIRQMYIDRDYHTELLKVNRVKFGVSINRLETARLQREKCEKELEKAMAKQKECQKVMAEISFAKQCGNIMRQIEKEIMGEIRDKMEERTSEYFKKLNWKVNTYSNITLNDDYQLSLIHVDGYSCVGTCSAAERCLLAFSFTLALHEISGFNSLLFIDTPVARVSDINRKNFSMVLNQVSKEKQIILAFAPDEFSPDVQNVLEPDASSIVHLSLHNEKEIYCE